MEELALMTSATLATQLRKQYVISLVLQEMGGR
jgi:hypothetical protein